MSCSTHNFSDYQSWKSTFYIGWRSRASGCSVASGGDDATVRTWDVLTGQSLGIFQGHDRPVQSIVYSPDA
ncbi:hypothetical protein [Myxacorys almedinensis]|uniref:Uncharacterized protein n=1 Tax=Myxacorys almedinensis A TaxID=2690445 RepID=A0A8J8CNM0_9CYAN|nr:hypothetical protein [Myxacorys almedinensis]NDJ19715.1 hypothetical protein [Myxacorys almedinensis A]